MTPRRRPVTIALVASGLVSATAALAAPAATGDARGIGLARAVLRAYQHVPTQSYVEHGLVWMSAMDGKAPTFQWAYGFGPYPGAYPLPSTRYSRSTAVGCRGGATT